ncbi:MAG: O-antigen ligase family protein [Flavobacteriales bacterium]|nr:O-antigen ligase family protein [Flavobacteriales bacterium]
MIDYVKDELQFFLIVAFWIFATVFLGPAIYALLPITVFLFARREDYANAICGFLIILVFSDMTPDIFPMRKIKTAKYAYIIALSIIVIMEQRRFVPLSKVFNVFLPFFAYAFFPLVFGNDPVTGIQKTISYALLYLIVPNYVLANFRMAGWDFFRKLIYFIVALLLATKLMQLGPNWWAYVGGRYRGFFGNPNGLGIFCYLVFVLFTALITIKRDLFTFNNKVFIYLVIVYFLLACGSRTSLTATLMFLLFSRFFSLSPFIGFVAFIAFLGIIELISSNLSSIVISLGLEEYFRVETLDDGSGRYIAWRFAWEKIQDYFMFGGGFGNDEYIMRQNYAYLRGLGHHGGVHNSYLTMWFNTGIIGLLIFFRSFFLIFFKANKRLPFSFAIMFSTMFSVLYESWLTGSLNPFTIVLVMIMTVISEEEIVDDEADAIADAEIPVPVEDAGEGTLVPGMLPRPIAR